jgi:hypothetical protein
MQNMDRRRLFKLAGVGSVVVAGAALPVVGRIANQESDVFGFRATVGLPEAPLPSYATFVIEGTVNLATRTGLLTSRVLAGHPGALSEIGLPRPDACHSCDRRGQARFADRLAWSCGGPIPASTRRES